MKNFIQPGDTVTVAAPYDVAAGAGCLVGSLFGVASYAAVSGAQVEIVRSGIFTMPKVGSQAWAVGVPVFWDDTNKHLTSTASTHKRVGVATAAVGSGAGETTGTVLLTGAAVN